MKVLIIVQNNSFPFDKRVSKEAKSLICAGNNVYVISPQSIIDQKKSEYVDGIRVVRYKVQNSDGSFLGFFLEYLVSISKIFMLATKLIIFERIDIIHVANPPDFFWPLAVLGKILKIKFIYDQHDLAPEMLLTKFNSRFLFYLLKLNQLLSLKLANGVIFVNNTFRDLASEHIANIPTTVVYNGPPSDFDIVNCDELKQKYSNSIVILYVGLMTKNDNIEVVVEVAEIIKRVGYHKHIKFVLVGDGDIRPKIEELVKLKKIESMIEFTGLLPYDSVKKYLSLADVCIAPDKPNGLNEFLTLVKVLEYMKMRKPFVAFKLEETMKMAGDAGLYAGDENEFADNILKLLDSHELREKMGLIGKKIVEDEYSWDIQSKKLIDFYETIKLEAKK